MKKLAMTFCLLVISSAYITAQQPSDFKRTELYVGYSNELSDNGSQDSESLHGFEVAAVYNVKRYIGIKADFSASFNQNRIATSGFNGTGFFSATYKQRNSLYNLLGGIQIKDNANKGRFKPFAHALAGAGFIGSSVSEYRCTSVQACPFYLANDNSNGFAAALGGGLDVRINKKIQVRAFQVDYNPIKAFQTGTQKNVRFGAGIVF